MKVLILFTSLLAVVCCSWIPKPTGYHGPEHVPVIKNGVPVETPEVQHAKAAHFAAISKEVSNPHFNHHDLHENKHENHYEHHENHYEHEPKYDHDVHSLAYKKFSLSYHGPEHVPVIKNGVPVETFEVQHAKAAHFAAISKEVSNSHYNHDIQENKYENHYEHHENNYEHQPKYDHDAHSVAYKKFPLAYETSHVVPEIGHDGTPLDTPEVESAKSHHFEAFGKALAMTAPHSDEPEPHYRYTRSIYDAYVPVIGHGGVPVEPIEVQKARQQHLAAHASAHHSSSYGFSVHQAHPQSYGHHDSYEIPHIGHDGKPLDTAEVEHAKAAHFSAHQEALARNAGHYGHVDYWNSQNDYHY